MDQYFSQGDQHVRDEGGRGACEPRGQTGRRKCILSLDGGGVRGIMCCVMLQQLESHLQILDGGGARIADYFDEVAGTSTGALVACLLVAPGHRLTAKATTDFYLQNSAKVFPPQSGVFSSARSWVSRLMGPKYSPTSFEAVLKDVFGDLKLSQTVKPVIVPSYDINYQIAVLFSTTQAKSKQLPDCYIRDVCRATTAAPTYFPPYHFTCMGGDGEVREFNMVDGGISANNPAFIAVSELLKDRDHQVEDDEMKYEDLLVLSLGTGKTMVSYNAKTTSQWGALSWVFYNGRVPLMDMLMLASQDNVDYNMSNVFYQQCCQNNYLRIQMEKLELSQMQLDNSSESNLQSLIISAEKILQSKAQMRDKMGQIVPDPRWTTYDAALFQFASWLSEEKKARNSQQYK